MSKIRREMVEEKVCGTCVHFHQHFALLEGGGFYPLWYGHCSEPRLKDRTPGETCPHWEVRAEQ